MKHRKVYIILLLTVAAFRCAGKPRILDYLTLPPPAHVSAAITAGGIEVSWKEPERATKEEIFEYRIYLSERSLMYTPISELPAPAAVLPPGRTRTIVPMPAFKPPYFLHLRSATKTGNLSLPSLPEIRLQPNASLLPMQVRKPGRG